MSLQGYWDDRIGFVRKSAHFPPHFAPPDSGTGWTGSAGWQTGLGLSRRRGVWLLGGLRRAWAPTSVETMADRPAFHGRSGNRPARTNPKPFVLPLHPSSFYLHPLLNLSSFIDSLF